MLLALVCVGWLIYFINHISQSISVNHIVDRLARETELVIGELMPYPRAAFPLQQRSEATLAADEAAVLSAQSGYIRFINIGQLVAVAKAWGISVHERAVSGSSCQPACRLSMCSAGARAAGMCRPSHRRLRYRSKRAPCSRMSSSASFRSPISGCALYLLRSTIPAHSDQLRGPAEPHHPPTWTSCTPPPSHYYAPPHVLRLVVPWMSFDGLLDTAFSRSDTMPLPTSL